MDKSDDSLLWGSLIFNGKMGNMNKRHQIAFSVDDGAKILCPIEINASRVIHQQSRLMAFRLSSKLDIEVIRKSRLPGIKHAEGTYSGSIVDLIKQDKTIFLNDGIGQLTIQLLLSNDHANIIIRGIDERLGALETNSRLGQASDVVETATNIGSQAFKASSTLGDVFTPLGQTLQLIVKIVDDLADAHPILKASWIVLSAVYKAVQKQKAHDDAVRELVDSLREMLGAANACADLREIENTTRVSESIGLAALDIALLIEECTKYASFSVRLAQTQFKDLSTRVIQCKEQCQGLLEKFERRIHIQNHQDLKDIKHTLNIEIEANKKEEIFKWLEAPDPSFNYTSAREKRCKGTGDWFLKRAEYEEWKKVPDLPLFLWGAPGFGKTILCSTVINDIIDHCTKTGPKTAYAYFIFDGRNLQTDFQEHRKFIRSLIKQLSHRYASFPLPLKDLYGDGSQKPSLEGLENTLLNMLDEFEDVFIVIDSLDECTEWDHLASWFKGLSQNHTGKLHLFATSRPEYDIQEDLKTIPRVNFMLQEEHVANDLAVFVQNKVQTNRKLNKLTNRMDITETVSINASGMFRLVALRLDQLQQCHSEADIEEQLADLPNDLDEMYRQMIDKVQLAYRQRVLLVLQWLAFSRHSITLKEVAEVVAVDFPNKPTTSTQLVPHPRFNPKRRFADENDLLGICGGLVNVMSHGEVMLSHLSVREYLLSSRRQQESSPFYFSAPLAHSAIAQTCIAYLLQFRTGLPDNFHQDFPLASYAAANWYLHTSSAEEEILDDEKLFQMTNELLLSKPAFETAIQIYNPHRDFGYHRNVIEASLLYSSALMGLRRATAEFLESGMDPNKEETELLGNALSAASIRGSVDIVRMLLKKGVDPNIKGGRCGRPLLAALESRHVEVIEVLLEGGANPNVHKPDGHERGAVHSAVLANRTDIVLLLIKHGANIDMLDASGTNALQDVCTSNSGAINMVTFLLDHGADPNYRGESCALQAAAYRGHTEVVNVLLSYGANPKLKGRYLDLGMPLHAAAAGGSRPIIDIFLDAGVDINSEAGKYGGVVQAASAAGHFQLVKFFLDNGADPNLTAEGQFEHALVTATTSGSLKIVEMLLKKGVNPNIPAARYALQVASANGNEEIVKLLLQNGADPDILGGWHGSALQAALNGGFTNIVQILLEHGADPNNFGPEAPSPLYRAAEDGYLVIAELLLNHNADPTLHGGRYKTALHVASHNGHTKIVKLLLEKGADSNIPGAQGHGNPVHIASTNGHGAIVKLLLDNGAVLDAEGAKYAITVASAEGYPDIVELLLGRGADPNVAGGWYGTPLQAASLNGYLSIVNLLLEKGANANIQAGHYGTPLQAAAFGGNFSIVNVLLDKGAKPNQRSGHHGTPLQAASVNGHLSIIEILLDEGANPNAIGGWNGSALQAASLNGYLAIVDFLLQRRADPNIQAGRYGNALIAASYSGHSEIVALLLTRGADCIEAGGYNALEMAITHGHAQIVTNLLTKLCLDSNAELAGSEITPLQAAARAGHTDVVEALLGYGADPNYWSMADATVLELSCLGGYTEIVQLLLAHGANPKVLGPEGGPLNAAIVSGNAETVRLLLQHDIDPYEPGPELQKYRENLIWTVFGTTSVREEMIKVLEENGYLLFNKELLRISHSGCLDLAIIPKEDLVYPPEMAFDGPNGRLDFPPPPTPPPVWPDHL